MDLQLHGHIAIVTGGPVALVARTAAGFLQEGCRVACWDASPRLAESIAELQSETGQPEAVIGVPCNITDLAACQSALETTIAQSGTPQHLVHAAAIGSGKFGFPFTNLAPADWKRVFEVNVLGTTNIAHTIAPVFVQQKLGTLVFVASVAGQIGSQTDPPYSASKAANINFAQCLAKDLAVHSVRVNTVCPGMVQTPLNRGVWQAWHDQQPPEKRRTYEEWASDKIRQIVPLGRWQQCRDIADMIVFLSSARGEVTGQQINVDGGFVMHW